MEMSLNISDLVIELSITIDTFRYKIKKEKYIVYKLQENFVKSFVPLMTLNVTNQITEGPN